MSLIIDRPHRINGSIIGYHLAKIEANGALAGHYVSAEDFNRIEAESKTAKVEKEKHAEKLDKMAKDKNEPFVVTADNIASDESEDEDAPKRGRKKKSE